MALLRFSPMGFDMTRFDILLIVMIALTLFGWPSGLIAPRLASSAVTIVVLVVLIVLLVLGVARF